MPLASLIRLLALLPRPLAQHAPKSKVSQKGPLRGKKASLSKILFSYNH